MGLRGERSVGHGMVGGGFPPVPATAILGCLGSWVASWGRDFASKSVEVPLSVYYFGKGDVLPDISDFDRDAFALFRFGDDDDESAFDTRDPVALLADVFDLNVLLVTFFDGRCRRTPFFCCIRRCIAGLWL